MVKETTLSKICRPRGQYLTSQQATHSNMGFLGNIFSSEKRIPFFVGVAYIQR
jgi:hypothetical protein